MPEQVNEDSGIDEIQVPDIAPSDNPDNEAVQEGKVYEARSKAMSPGVRADKLQAEHTEALKNHADFHAKDCEKWESEAMRLQTVLMQEKEKEINLVAENARLKEITHSINFFNWLAYLSTVVGAICVGIAGAMPGLSDVGKSGFASFGIALTLVGLGAASFSHFKSKRIN